MNAFKGFTLLELVIVMAIAALTVISVPPMIQWLNRQGIQHAVEQLRSDLQLARVMAIRKQQTCSVIFNQPKTNQYINSINGKIVDLAKYRGNVQFLSFSPDDDAMSSKINFTGRGMCAPAADVYLADGGMESVFRVRVLVPGGISIFRWNGENWR
jgi:prepilin-type N-terminal cleavage/methylation domain-containing protein